MSNPEIKKLLRQLKEREHKKDWKGESEICSVLGELYYQDGDYQNALLYHQQDRQACECIGDKKGMAQAMRKIGEVYTEQQNYKKSLENQNGYLQIARELGDLPEEQRALATLGRTHLYMSESELCEKQEQLKKSKTYFKMCLSAAENITSQVDHREKQEMRGRAQENLGTVYWHLGNKTKAAFYHDLAEKAFETLKDGNEDLCRLLDGMASLNIEDKNLDVALKLCDKSIVAAKGVRHDRDKLVCGSLLTKSKVLLFLKDFEGSKASLRAAYKLNIKTAVSDEVERNLKIMKVIVEAQDEMDESSHKNYEKIADTLLEYMGNRAELKYVYEMAVHYYQLALARADNNGDQVAIKDLNWSIADTYKDMGIYNKTYFENAKTYFERQIQYQAGKPLEQCLTKSNIANVMDYLGEDFERIACVIRSWRDLAKEAGDIKQEVFALEELAKLEETRGKNPSGTREIIDKLKSEIPEEDFVSSSQGSVDKLADVNIDEVDTSDEEEEVAEKPRRLQSLKIKKKFTQNNLGEFPLHIKVKTLENGKSIRKLIQDGHPLEAKDHAGWTPLGEAANTGITEYAKILVDAGANINAKEDLGFTPLMSASYKGHLDIVEFLLGKDAKVQLRNKNNETALSFLRDHQKEARNPRSPHAEDYNRPGVREQIDRLIERMEEAFVKLGLPVDHALPKNESSDEEDTMVEEEPEKEIRRNRLSLGKNRTQRSRDDSFSDGGPITSTQRSVNSSEKHRSPPLPVMSQIPSRSSTMAASQFARQDTVGASQYKDAICRIGSSAMRAMPTVAPLKPKNGPQAYTDVDDWLEVDVVTPTVKKRKRSGGEGSVNRKEAKKRSDVFGSENKNPVSKNSASRSSRRSSEEFEPPTHDLTDDVASPVFKIQPKSLSKRPGLLSTKSHKKKQQQQPKISNFVTRTSRSPSPNMDIPPERPTSPLLKRVSSSLQKVSSNVGYPYFVPEVPVPVPQIVVAVSTQRVKVRVKERLLLIPIPASEKDVLKVSWLSSEAAARYCRAEGAEPVLKLTTVDGAEFDPDDLLSVAIPMDSNEILETQVIRWNNKPINERYKDACMDLKSTCFKNITEQLSICETTHVLALKVPLKSSSAEPIFRSIRSSPGLKELKLTNCRLGDGGLPLLASVLPTLPALTTINLSNNRLSYTSLSLLAQTFQNSPPPLLSSLDLSHNPLGDLSCPDLARIVNSCPQLSSLVLSSCWFTVALFQSGRLDLAQAFVKVGLRRLIFSHNKVGPTGVELLLKTLPPTLRHLDVSGCVDESLPNLHFSQYLLRYVKQGNPEVDLNHLNASNLQLSDVNVPDLCSSLNHLGHLKNLDLSYNDISPQGLAELLTAANTHNAPISTLNLRGCFQLWDKGWEDFVVSVESRLGEGGLESLIVPENEEAKRLRRDWDLAWRDRSRHRTDVTGHLILSID